MMALPNTKLFRTPIDLDKAQPHPWNRAFALPPDKTDRQAHGRAQRGLALRIATSVSDMLWSFDGLRCSAAVGYQQKYQQVFRLRKDFSVRQRPFTDLS